MRRLLLSYCLFLFFTSSLLAQQKNTATLSTRFEEYAGNSDREKIALHLNSSFLLTGESLMFTVHCSNQLTGAPSAISRIAYVELVDETHTPVLQTKISLRNGRGSGDFFLPSSLGSGNFMLISYTRWMRNFSSRDFFAQQITIVNPFRKPTAPGQKKTDIDVTFYPEGGSGVSGVLNFVVFRALDAYGAPANVRGRLFDESGNTVTDIGSVHAGIGKFSYTPQDGKEYKVVFTDSLNEAHFKTLPRPNKDGIALHAMMEGDGYHIRLQKGGLDQLFQVRWLIHAGGKGLKEGTLNINNKSAELTVSNSQLQPGENFITFFDGDDNVMAERRLFVNSGGQGLTLVSDVQHTSPRGKVKVTVGGATSSLISAGVRQISSRKSSAAIYKSDDEAAMQEAYSIPWSQALKRMSQEIKYLPDLRGDLITGKVLDESGRPASRQTVYLSMPANEYLFFSSMTDSAGRFYFNSDKAYPSRDIFLNVSNAGPTKWKVVMDKDFLPSYEEFTPSLLSVKMGERAFLEQRSVYTQIENAYYKFRKDSVQPPTYLRFYGKPDEVYLLDDYNRFPTMEDVLREFVTSVTVRKKDEHFILRAVDKKSMFPFKGEPLILLDGIPVFDNDVIMNYDPLKVKKIEIVMRRYFYGPIDAAGIISFSTYDGDAKQIQSQANEKYAGVQPAKTYFSPDYSRANNDRMPDYRVQLYWNPALEVTGGSASFDFFASDVIGDFEIVVEEMRKNGTLVRESRVIQVNPE